MFALKEGGSRFAFLFGLWGFGAYLDFEVGLSGEKWIEVGENGLTSRSALCGETF